jgi:hypothetical protein
MEVGGKLFGGEENSPDMHHFSRKSKEKGQEMKDSRIFTDSFG